MPARVIIQIQKVTIYDISDFLDTNSFVYVSKQIKAAISDKKNPQFLKED